MTTCTDCIYWRRTDGNSGTPGQHMCHYALDNWPQTRAHDGRIELAKDCTHRKAASDGNPEAAQGKTI